MINEQSNINKNFLNFKTKTTGKYTVELFDKDTGKKVDQAVSYNSVYQPSITNAYNQICFGQLSRGAYDYIYPQYHQHILFGMIMLCNEPDGYLLDNNEKLLSSNYVGYALYNVNYANSSDTVRGTMSTGCSTQYNFTNNNINNARAISYTRTLVYDWPTYAANDTITHIKMASYRDCTNSDWTYNLECNNRTDIYIKQVDDYQGGHTISKDNNNYYIQVGNTSKIYVFDRYTWEKLSNITFINTHASVFKYNDLWFAMNGNGQIFKYDNAMNQIQVITRDKYVTDSTLTLLDFSTQNCSLIVESDKVYIPYRYDVTKNGIKYRGCKVAILSATDLSYISEITIVEKDLSKITNGTASYPNNSMSGIFLCKMDKDKISVVLSDFNNGNSTVYCTYTFNFITNTCGKGTLLNCYTGNTYLRDKTMFQGSGTYGDVANLYYYDQEFDFYACINCNNQWSSNYLNKQFTLSVPYGWLSTTKLDKPITKTSQNTMKITYQLTTDYLYPCCDTFYEKLKEKESTPI
jgi:hypothetical protein